MRVFFCSLYVLSLILLCAPVARAQDPYHISINRLSGLPSNAVYALFQDKKGFVWIANDNGLTRYDGYEYKTYYSNKQTSRAGNQILEDQYGRIWYKNFDGNLYYVEHDSMKALPQRNAISNAGYGMLDNMLVVKQTDSLAFYDLKTLRQLRSIAFDNTKGCGELCHDRTYYHTTKDTLWTIAGDGTMKAEYMPGNGSPILSGYGVILARTTTDSNTISRLDNGKRTLLPISKKIGYIQKASYEDSVLWIMTANGLWGYDQQWKPVNNGMPYLPGKNLSCMMRDREGNYWLGSLDEGIILLPDRNTKLWTEPGTKPCVFARTPHSLMVGTKESRVYKRRPGTDSFAKVFETSPPHEIYCIATDSTESTYIIAGRTMSITNNKFEVTGKEWIASKDLIMLDRKYCAVAASGTSGLLKMKYDKRSAWDRTFERNKIAGIKNYAPFETTAGRGRTLAFDAANAILYMGSSTGIKKIDTNRISDVLWHHQPVYARKLAFYNNTLYVLTQQGQLLRTENDQQLQMQQVVDSDEEIMNMRRTESNLYLITSAGIRRLEKEGGAFRFVYIRSGIRPEEINDLEDDEARLMIATDRGVLFAEEIKNTTTHPPGFCLNSILVNGREVAADNISGLEYGQKDVELRYSILSYGQINRFVLQYRINDGAWQQAERNTRRLKLASMAPDKYTVGFRLVSTDKKIYEQPPVRFVIRQPFWQQGWFWAVCFAITGLMSLLYYRWRTSQMRRKNELIIEKMALENHLRHSTLTAIRAQMNPHFFYNALNTIQSFIFSDDKRNASTYLVKMSKLTRMILEMSDKESVTLEEETEALRLYLELEKIRFGTDFNYRLTIDGSVDTEMLKIPPMIVQPYVENAIKHGLLHKAGNKALAISFARTDGALAITIDDNGIGRERATELQEQRKEKHQSFSTGANSKRIDLLNRDGRRNIGVVYIDKKTDGHATGTTVIITIPIA